MNPLTNAKVVGAGIDPNAYHRQEVPRGDKSYVMSRGDLMEFARCPRRWLKGYQSDGSTSTEHGTLIDGMVLDAAKFVERFKVTPETYTDAKTGEQKPWNWNANVCKAWREEANGATVVKHDHFVRAKEAVSVLRSNPVIVQLLDQSQHQVMVVAEWHDKATGLVVPIKRLIDIVPNQQSGFSKSLWDLKTAASAATHPWKRSVFEHGYHVQAAMDLDAYTAATGEDRIDYRHIVQENYEPWETDMCLLSAEFVELGRMQYVSALVNYCKCLASGEWPGYEAQTVIEGCRLIEPDAFMVNP